MSGRINEIIILRVKLKIKKSNVLLFLLETGQLD